MLFYIEQQLGLAAKAKFEVTNFTTDQIGQHECVFFLLCVFVTSENDEDY
jgi:hypothetical protein